VIRLVLWSYILAGLISGLCVAYNDTLVESMKPVPVVYYLVAV
jgi:hypothetical protein